MDNIYNNAYHEKLFVDRILLMNFYIMSIRSIGKINILCKTVNAVKNNTVEDDEVAMKFISKYGLPLISYQFKDAMTYYKYYCNKNKVEFKQNEDSVFKLRDMLIEENERKCIVLSKLIDSQCGLDVYLKKRSIFDEEKFLNDYTTNADYNSDDDWCYNFFKRKLKSVKIPSDNIIVPDSAIKFLSIFDAVPSKECIDEFILYGLWKKFSGKTGFRPPIYFYSKAWKDVKGKHTFNAEEYLQKQELIDLSDLPF